MGRTINTGSLHYALLLIAFFALGIGVATISQVLSKSVGRFIPSENYWQGTDVLVKRKGWIWSSFLVVVVYPIFEELFFRYMPFILVTVFHLSGWVVGTVSSLLFAYLHKAKITLLPFPLIHFFLGVFFWLVMLYSGLACAVVCHIGWNATACVLKIFAKNRRNTIHKEGDG
jgi:membrane protease YdiL (CAAX protease family)